MLIGEHIITTLYSQRLQFLFFFFIFFFIYIYHILSVWEFNLLINPSPSSYFILCRYIIVHDAPLHTLFDIHMFPHYREYNSPYCNGPTTAVMSMLAPCHIRQLEEDCIKLQEESDIYGQVPLPPLLSLPPPLHERQIVQK